MAKLRAEVSAASCNINSALFQCLIRVYTAKVDKRGRPVTASHKADQLKRFYRLKSPEAAEGEGEGFIDYARGEGALYSSGSEDESDEDESEVEEEELEVGGKKKVRLPAMSESESESDDDHLDIDLSENEETSVFPPEDR